MQPSLYRGHGAGFKETCEQTDVETGQETGEETLEETADCGGAFPSF